MAEPLAAVDDVETLFRSLSDTEAITAERLLRIASNMVRNRFRDIDARILAFSTPVAGVTPIDPDIVTDVVTTMVVRVLRNPEGVKSETVGPNAAVYDSNVGAGYVFLTDTEAAMIAPAPLPGVGSIKVREGMARGLERRADPELRRGGFLGGVPWYP